VTHTSTLVVSMLSGSRLQSASICTLYLLSASSTASVVQPGECACVAHSPRQLTSCKKLATLSPEMLASFLAISLTLKRTT